MSRAVPVGLVLLGIAASAHGNGMGRGLELMFTPALVDACEQQRPALAGALRSGFAAWQGRLTAEERHTIESGQESYLAPTTKTSIWSLLRRRNVWGIAIPRMLADPTWGTLSFWVPIYLMKERGFDRKQIFYEKYD